MRMILRVLPAHVSRDLVMPNPWKSQEDGSGLPRGSRRSEESTILASYCREAHDGPLLSPLIVEFH